jgi:hypothetical protein
MPLKKGCGIFVAVYGRIPADRFNAALERQAKSP